MCNRHSVKPTIYVSEADEWAGVGMQKGKPQSHSFFTANLSLSLENFITIMHSKSFIASAYSLLLFVAGASALSAEPGVRANPVIKLMANGMSLLKPVFVAESKVQASVLGANVDADEVEQEIASEVGSEKIVIYTYGLSPFSSEAVSVLEKTGYPFKQIELGAEWFLLGGKESVKRVLLSEKAESGASSLPKVFVNGNCIGGCAELADAVESGELDSLMQTKAPAQKKMFSFL